MSQSNFLKRTELKLSNSFIEKMTELTDNTLIWKIKKYDCFASATFVEKEGKIQIVMNIGDKENLSSEIKEEIYAEIEKEIRSLQENQ